MEVSVQHSIITTLGIEQSIGRRACSTNALLHHLGASFQNLAHDCTYSIVATLRHLLNERFPVEAISTPGAIPTLCNYKTIE